MKRLNRWMCAACCLYLLLSAGPAHAAFSQGLERLAAWERAGGRIEAEIAFSPQELFSVGEEGMPALRALLDSLTLRYAWQQSDAGSLDEWTLLCGGQEAAFVRLTVTDQGAALESDLLPFAVRAADEASLLDALGLGGGALRTFLSLRAQTAGEAALPALSATPGEAREEQITVTQAQLAAAIPALAARLPQPYGAALTAFAAGWTLQSPLEIKLDVAQSGAITRLQASLQAARAQETPWTVELDVRNGSNLDAELTLEQDSRNTMTFALAVESGREDGEDTQRIRLNASGKLAGYSRQIRVSATLRNAAQTDEAGQTVETLRNTLSVGFTDRSPAMQMLSLGDFSLSVKERGEAVLGEAAQDVRLTDELEAELLVGGKEWLIGTAAFSLAAAPAQAVAWPETALDVDALTDAQRDALESLQVTLLQRLWPVLPPDAQALLLP